MLPVASEEVVMGPKVSDVMTSEVVCARLSTPYQELVRLLAETHISAAPVVDDVGHVLGVVSEACRWPAQRSRT